MTGLSARLSSRYFNVRQDEQKCFGDFEGMVNRRCRPEENHFSVREDQGRVRVTNSKGGAGD